MGNKINVIVSKSLQS